MRRNLLIALSMMSAPFAAACDQASAAAPVDPPPTVVAPTAEPSAEEGDPVAEPEREPAAENAPEPIEVDRRSRFLGELDHAMRRSLANEEIAEIERGHGGRSLAFKITLADGTVGYYKPEQTFSAAHYYSELGAYYLDRELGLGRVPPTIGRVMDWDPLRRAAMGDERVDEVIVQEDGTVRGAFIWWIPERLERLAAGRGWDKWVRNEGPLYITPFQRPRHWRDDRVMTEGEVAADAPDTEDRAAELSDMIVFDYLTTNVDRWGGNFQNVRTRGEGGPLIYLDNGAGFTAGPRGARVPLMDDRLHAVQRFRRSTLDRLRRLDRSRLERRMADDPLAPFLTDRQLDDLFERRDHVLEHAAEMEQRFGERAWL
jgi:hypothetical protein